MENTNKNANGKDEKKPISIKLIIVFFIVSLFAVSALVSNIIPIWAKIILFTLFSAMEGYILSFIKYVVDPAVIKMAIAGTMGIFTTMFIFGMILIFMGVTLGVYVGLILLFALLGLIITRIVYMFMGDYSQVSRGLAIFSLGLFSLFIIYDTNQIMQRDYFGDFIKASLDYYLDIINIFLNLTRLMDDN
jgi:FtsH-binding integral membrane protein